MADIIKKRLEKCSRLCAFAMITKDGEVAVGVPQNDKSSQAA
jgi:hypothetical protein